MSDKELNSVIDRAEDEYQKLKDKVIEQGFEIEELKELCNKYEEEHKTTFGEWKKSIAIIDEFEKWLLGWIENEQYCFMSNNPKDRCRREVFEEVLHHFKELKGSDKE